MSISSILPQGPPSLLSTFGGAPPGGLGDVSAILQGAGATDSLNLAGVGGLGGPPPGGLGDISSILQGAGATDSLSLSGFGGLGSAPSSPTAGLEALLPLLAMLQGQLGAGNTLAPSTVDAPAAGEDRAIKEDLSAPTPVVDEKTLKAEAKAEKKADKAQKKENEAQIKAEKKAKGDD